MRMNLRMRLIVLNPMPMHVHGVAFSVSGSLAGGTVYATPADVRVPGQAEARDGDSMQPVRRQGTMQDIHNGISAAELVGAAWKKSQRSNSQGACVEIARLDRGTIAMRNSRDPRGTALVYPAEAVRALVSAVRTGEFDYLVS